MQKLCTNVILIFLALLLQACGQKDATEQSMHRQSTDAVEAARIATALRAAEQAINKGEYRAAHDALLHAMITDASSTELFDHATRLVGVLIERGEDEALDMAEDILSRLDQMVPYQPLDRHSALRLRLGKAWGRIPSPSFPSGFGSEEVAGTEVWFGNLNEHLELLKRPDLPASLKLVIVRDAVAERDRAMLGWISDSSRNGALSEGEAGTRWDEYTRKIEAAEHSVLEELFRERVVEFDRARRAHERLRADLGQVIDLDRLSDWRVRNEQVRAALRESFQWEREFLGHLENGVPDAAGRLRDVADLQAGLAWDYSRTVLNWISMVEKLKMTGRRDNRNFVWVDIFFTPTGEVNPETERNVQFETIIDGLRKPSTEMARNYAVQHRSSDSSLHMVKLLLLSLVDADMLTPYVREQYDSQWKKSFAELDIEGKVEMSKVRILGELR